MSNPEKTNIISSSYKEMFNQKSERTSMAISTFVVIALFSVLTGLLGYYIGDRGIAKNLSSGKSQNSSNLQVYSSDELNKMISSDKYDFNLYQQIIANLKDKYVDKDKVDDDKLFNGSLKGLVDSIGDKATNYFSPKDYKEYKESFSGAFQGIGVRLEYQNNRVVVMDVIKDSPAEKIGVQVGYIFNKVDGTDVASSSIEEIVAKVRGEAGSKVKVSFIDPSSGDQVEKEITRTAITVDSMRLVEKSPDTVVFEVSRFTEDTLEKWNSIWDKNVDQIVAKGYKNVVLDLRGNGGGFLDGGIHAANDFLEPGKLIVKEKSKVKADKDTLSTNKTPRLKDKNVVILINGGTASASEILTGAIKFHNNYKVYGTRSYGKGTVQNTYDLPNGGALKITTEYWILPTGKRLDNDNPINPDVEVKYDQNLAKEGKDNVLDEAMKQFK